jgi:replicative DNA helicase
MKRLLRSIIDFKKDEASQENLVFNFSKLMNAKVEWARPDDEKVYNFCYQYFSSALEMPAIQTVRDYFERTDDLEVTERLKDIEASEFYIRTNFSHLLLQILEEQNKLKAVAILKEAHEIVTRGLEIGGERKFGVRDGLTHITSHANDLIAPNFNARFRGNVRQDGLEMRNEYINARNNRSRVWGRFSGIEEIDKACRGAKKGELWVHGAFPGELKSTFAANWCYNLVTKYKTNVLFISLEMPYEQIRRNVYTLHAANQKWVEWGIRPPEYVGLDYRKIRDGELSPEGQPPTEDELFYLEKVIPDFNNNTEYARFEVLNPDREMTMTDIRMEAELLNRQAELGFVVIDHGQWVEARKGKKNRDYTIELNSIVRDAKQFAMRFNNNAGIPVLLLWQINREGKEEANKNNGEYKLKAFTYANEVEKTADVVTTTYLNESHREHSTARMSNPKNRDNAPFLPFDVHANLSTRRMYTIDKASETGSGMGVNDAAAMFADLNNV